MSYPYSNDTTSFDTAQSNETKRLSQRQCVYDLIRQAGLEGCTDDELMARTGLRGSSLHPRRWQLAKDGIIKDSGRTRPTSSGMDAIVWVVTQLETLNVSE